MMSRGDMARLCPYLRHNLNMFIKPLNKSTWRLIQDIWTQWVSLPAPSSS